LSTDAVQLRLMSLLEAANPFRLLGVEGGEVSGAAGVVTETGLDAADRFCAASLAFTVNE
jgi:hypothetical protein